MNKNHITTKYASHYDPSFSPSSRLATSLFQWLLPSIHEMLIPTCNLLQTKISQVAPILNLRQCIQRMWYSTILTCNLLQILISQVTSILCLSQCIQSMWYSANQNFAGRFDLVLRPMHRACFKYAILHDPYMQFTKKPNFAGRFELESQPMNQCTQSMWYSTNHFQSIGHKTKGKAMFITRYPSFYNPFKSRTSALETKHNTSNDSCFGLTRWCTRCINHIERAQNMLFPASLSLPLPPLLRRSHKTK